MFRKCRLIALLAACTPSVDPAPPAAGYTGEFVLARVVTYVPGEAPTIFIFAEASFASPEPEALSLDAGDDAGLIEPETSSTLPLIRRVFQGEIFYQHNPDTPPFDEELFQYDSAYSVYVEGTKIDGGVGAFEHAEAILTPGTLRVTTPDFTQRINVSTSDTIELTWTGSGDAADRVLVVLIVSDGTSGTQIGVGGSDDGSLTIAAATLANLGVGDGSLTLYRINDGSFALPDSGTATTRGMVGETALMTVTQ